MRVLGVVASVLLVVALVVLFAAERILGFGPARDVLLWSGLALLASAIGWRAFELSRASGAARKVELSLLAASLGVAVALGLHALSTDWGLDLLGLDRESAERAGGILSSLFSALLLVSLAALLFTELVYRRMPIAEAVELRRVRGAALGGIGLALAVVFVASINYVASARDMKKDLSYFRTSRPSESTLRMVERLGEPLSIVLFYPKVNEVLDQLEPYFREVAAASDAIAVEVIDHALSPEVARKHKVTANGRVILARKEGDSEQAEPIMIGTTLEEARSRLKKLDGSFQQAFMKLTRSRRELLLTVGHDERNVMVDPVDEAELTKGLIAALQRSNVSTRDLGPAQGLAQAVPEEAPAVAVLGPRKPFLPEEAGALLEYVKGGGRLIVMVDPDVDHGLDPLLHGLGLELRPGVAVSEREYIRRTGTPADRANVFTNRYSAHPIVTLASRNASQVATIFIRGGGLARHEGKGQLDNAKVQFTVRTSAQAWRDLDGDFERGEGEPLEEIQMVAAVTVPNPGGEEGRAVVIADGSFVTDQVLRNPGNSLIFGDAMTWLIGEEQIVGETTSEEDVRIEHTRDEDKLWFYATSFAVPLPFLGVGIFMALRRRRTSEVREPPRGSAEGGRP